MAGTVERIIIQATATEKKAIVAKARKLALPISELMRRGALAYESQQSDADLGLLADAAKGAADRAGLAIEDALDFIVASNKRIDALEVKAARARARKAG